MRVLHVVVPPDRREAASEALESQEFTFVAIPLEEESGVLLEAPLPSNAIGDALDALEEAEVDIEEYTVIASGEAALTATSETLEQRYAGDYEPLTGVELRTKARDLSRDTASYVALMTLAAVIATAGLLVDSPAIVVGSMVIAPIIGPALTASVGVVTSDRRMIVESLWMQLYGLGLAVLAATALASAFRFGGFVPTRLDLPALDLLGVRVAPNALSLVVGLAAGFAAGIGLTTKGPTSIIGVMIAAALIPTAGATGIAIAWVEPELVLGTLTLLVVTMLLINAAVLTVLLGFGYRGKERATWNRDVARSWAKVGALAIVVVAITLAVVVATAGQVVVDREVVQATEDVLEEPAHEDLTAVSIQTQYTDFSPFTGPLEVTVVVAEEGDAEPDAFAADLADRIEDRTGESIDVRVQSLEYESATAGGTATG
ncbi:TIGR00341 family protein [Natronobeatus ordinarius]|uniref:TIGR00341 family protein n=1 Tax=Natronobeatus ordinarius TaxID=2963433 RepID=UPI0020CD9A8F|nr:TIGR00341 family protein [Natronobeatus ordinarius]